MGWHPRRERRRRRLAELETMRHARRLVAEDVTALGEQLAAHAEHMSASAGHAMRTDFERAQESYDIARSALQQAATLRDVVALGPILEEGRYRLACALARRDGLHVPSRRDPCFFNPQHPPAAADVVWASPGEAQEIVAACRADADRVAKGEDPDSRLVRVGDRWVPWHTVGASISTIAESHAQAVRQSDWQSPRGTTAGASLDPLGPLS